MKTFIIILLSLLVFVSCASMEPKPTWVATGGEEALTSKSELELGMSMWEVQQILKTNYTTDILKYNGHIYYTFWFYKDLVTGEYSPWASACFIPSKIRMIKFDKDRKVSGISM